MHVRTLLFANDGISFFLQKTDAVSLELMNFEDLESLRTQRRESLNKMSSCTLGNPKFDHTSNKDALLGFSAVGSKSSANSQNQGSNCSTGPPTKKYFIVTYIAEFDKLEKTQYSTLHSMLNSKKPGNIII